MVKLYEFSVGRRLVRVEAETILEAKDKMVYLGFEEFKFERIKIIGL